MGHENSYNSDNYNQCIPKMHNEKQCISITKNCGLCVFHHYIIFPKTIAKKIDCHFTSHSQSLKGKRLALNLP